MVYVISNLQEGRWFYQIAGKTIDDAGYWPIVFCSTISGKKKVGLRPMKDIDMISKIKYNGWS